MNKSRLLPTLWFIFAVQVTGLHCSDRGKTAGNAGVEEGVPGNPSPAASHASNSSGRMGDFVTASKAVIPAVVHIKTLYRSSSGGSGNLLEQLYGAPSPESTPSMASGSGVTISADGYIATNNHVVENASAIEVVLPDRRVFPAELIGRDPNTDLALIRIKANKLPVVKLGNSDAVQVGEWVLAVGYPLSLNSTVTAGIISAKGRSIGIINRPGQNSFEGNPAQTGSTAIESFIQTDAAINPGNSGGALVNTDGELVGINTAIASQTGSYAGYAFAVPVNLVKKVLDDLKKYGTVKRGLLGVSFPAPSAEDQYLKQQGISPGSVTGVFITGVQEGSAAAQAGLKGGDIIQRIDGVQLASSAEFSERIARHRPGDVIKLTYLRDGRSNTASVTLKGEELSGSLAKNGQSLEEIYNKLGANFAPLSAAMKQRLNLRSGVVVTDVRVGGFFERVGIPRGTIIAFINGRPVDTPRNIEEAFLSSQTGMIQVLAIAPDGSRVAFDLSLGT